LSTLRPEDRCGIDGQGNDADIHLVCDDQLETWRLVWRRGLVPQLSTQGLQGLAKALEEDWPSLISGNTMTPPPLACMANEAVEGCCPLCFGLLDGLRPTAVSVGPLEERFAEACFKCSQLLGYPAAIRDWLNWVDETPREEMRKQLLIEVNLALVGRMPAEGRVA
jgi:hypothetical protein